MLHRFAHEGDAEGTMPFSGKEQWYQRFESSSLNVRPEEVESPRHSRESFRVEDPTHAMHIGMPLTAATGLGQKSAEGEMMGPD
jgi:hypothetical protein